MGKLKIIMRDGEEKSYDSSTIGESKILNGFVDIVEDKSNKTVTSIQKQNIKEIKWYLGVRHITGNKK